MRKIEIVSCVDGKVRATIRATPEGVEIDGSNPGVAASYQRVRTIDGSGYLTPKDGEKFVDAVFGWTNTSAYLYAREVK